MLIRKNLKTKIKSVDEEKYKIDFIFSTPDEDRHGEEIDQNGWKLNEFLENPVVLFAHDQWQPAVGKVVDIRVENGQLQGTVQFAVEENPFAKILFDLYKNGFMRAVSVGFSNNEYKFNEETERMVLLENVLYELSLVNVPANARALAKSKGIDMQPLEDKEKELREKKIGITQEDLTKITNSVEKKVKNLLKKDNARIKKKVETPTSKGVKKGFTKKELNQAIRELLKEKKKIKKIKIKNL